MENHHRQAERMTMNTKPTIELRKVSHTLSLSEETPAYTAQVWVDGKHFCDATNHGTGGPDMHYPVGKMNGAEVDRAVDALNKRIAETYPPCTYDDEGTEHSFPRTLELVCHELLEQRRIDAEVNRLLKANVMWLRGDKVFRIPLRTGRQTRTREALIAHVRIKEPNARFLHDMERDEQVKLLVGS